MRIKERFEKIIGYFVSGNIEVLTVIVGMCGECGEEVYFYNPEFEHEPFPDKCYKCNGVIVDKPITRIISKRCYKGFHLWEEIKRSNINPRGYYVKCKLCGTSKWSIKIKDAKNIGDLMCPDNVFRELEMGE
jgi:hypothetical protein